MNCKSCGTDLLPLWTYEYKWIKKGKERTRLFCCPYCGRVYGPPSPVLSELTEYKPEARVLETRQE